MSERPDAPRLGLTGRIAAAFINSKLTPLIILVSILLGTGATLILPREEEPQIIVPMADVMVRMPGASAAEVEQRVTSTMEKLIKEVSGVEYVYSISRPGASLVIVRFYVGENPEAALVRLYDKLYSHQDMAPPGVLWPPLIKARTIDDVPILALTLHGNPGRGGTTASTASHRPPGGGLGLDGYALRRIATQLDEQLKQVDNVATIDVIGGQRREVRVELRPDRLAAYGLSPRDVVGALRSGNDATDAGRFARNDRSILLRAGGFLTDAGQVRALLVAVRNGRPVYLRDVAEVIDGPEEPDRFVFFGRGVASGGPGGQEEAVTLAISKRRGANAITVSRAVQAKLAAIRGRYLPSGVQVDVTRDYGQTAADRSNELLVHMGIAVASVVALMWLALGRRESVVVAVAIPVTLALTLCTFVLYGFTLNRVTFFALIFSIGILVDDAIVVVENVVRHLRMPENRGRPAADVVVEAVDEVGNPTVLATLTVMAAILPMAFVRGLMGPYMRPIPLGASAAMLYSMMVAFVVVPWAALRILGRAHESGHGEEKRDPLTHLYRRAMAPLIHRAGWRTIFLTGTVGLLLAALSMVPLRLVLFKMLPFDNKSEFQVMVNAPEGTTLERTAALTRDLEAYLSTIPEVTNCQCYLGTAAPYNFNGLVRHYFLRSGPDKADIQVNLLPLGERHRSSHQIATAARPEITRIAEQYGAAVQVTEIPPGPPVLQTLVTEVYGPQRAGQIELARRILGIYRETPGVVDSDWYMERPQPQIRMRVDREKAALAGVSPDDATAALDTALAGTVAGLLHDPRAREPVPLLVRFSRPERNPDALESLQLPGRDGPVPLRSLLHLESGVADTTIYHKSLEPVVYVIGDVAGKVDSPLYAILDLQSQIARLPEQPATWYIQQPTTTERYAIKWDGEWQVTYEVFRDLGIAFAVVMILIYALIVGWFQDFLTPMVIVSVIPFSLVGIMPAHWALGAYFTATSMIGFIAGAGIVVRNSIILVDFTELRLRQGMPLDEAVVDAGAVRFRPIMLTAAAVVIGSSVILTDPIFQGLAISLMAGEVASLLLAPTTVPVLYYLRARRGARPPRASAVATGCLAALLVLGTAGAAQAAPGPRARQRCTCIPTCKAKVRLLPRPQGTGGLATPLHLTLAEAERRALATSPELDAARWKAIGADAGVASARSIGLPHLALRSGYDYVTPTLEFGGLPLVVNHNFNTGVVVQQALATFGRLHWSTLAATLQARAARAEAEQHGQDVLLAAREGYAGLLLARRTATLAEARLTASQGHLELARVRFDAGAAPRYEVIEMQSQVADAREALVAADTAAAKAKVALASLLGLPEGAALELDPLPAAPPAVPAPVATGPGDRPAVRAPAAAAEDYPPTASAPSADDESAAEQRSPELTTLRWTVEAARARYGLARAQGQPRLDLEAGYFRRTATAFSTADQLSAGVTLNIPIFDGGMVRAQEDQAAAAIHELEARYAAARRAFQVRLRDAWLDLASARARVDAAHERQARADEMLRVAKLRYRGGVSIPLELVDAQTASSQAGADVADAEYGCHVAFWRWLRASGRAGVEQASARR